MLAGIVHALILYFTKQHGTKQEIKKKIHAIYDRIILHQLESNPSAVEKYQEVKDAAQQPFVLWQLYFPKVFKEKHGFDIVIGNPPYGLINLLERMRAKIRYP